MAGLLVMGGCLIKYFDYSFSFEHIASSIWQENETFAHFQVVDWLEMANYPNTPTSMCISQTGPCRQKTLKSSLILLYYTNFIAILTKNHQKLSKNWKK